MSQLVDAIRNAIETSDETRYRISKGTGVSQAQLSRLMAGLQGISIENAERIADYLGLKIIIRPKRRRRKVK